MCALYQRTVIYSIVLLTNNSIPNINIMSCLQRSLDSVTEIFPVSHKHTWKTLGLSSLVKSSLIVSNHYFSLNLLKNNREMRGEIWADIEIVRTRILIKLHQLNF